MTDTYTYGTYGNLTSHTGVSPTAFLFNGRDGVQTDSNGLYYMRARYYSPTLLRFVNADTLTGSIQNSETLNRFAYANGNPISFIDPFGRSSEPGNINFNADNFIAPGTTAGVISSSTDAIMQHLLHEIQDYLSSLPRPNNIGLGTWNKLIKAESEHYVNQIGGISKISQYVGYAGVAIDIGTSIYSDITKGVSAEHVISNAVVTGGFDAGGILASLGTGALIGSIVPVAGTAVGAVAGLAVGVIYTLITDVWAPGGETVEDRTKGAVYSFFN